MKVDLRYVAPFVAPFVVLALIRAVLWLAGAPLDGPGRAIMAVAALFFGSIAGGIVAAHEKPWLIHIGRRDD